MSAGDAAQRVKQQVQGGIAKAQREFDAAKTEAKRVNERAQTPPAKDADEAARQVRDLRARLDRDLAALEARIPPRENMLSQARAFGGALVGAVGLVGTATALRQKRKEKKAVEAEADRFAAAIARHLPAALAQYSAAQVDADGDGDTTGDRGSGRTLLILALLASAAFAVWTRVRQDDEPDIWGPAPEPPMPPTAPPADPSVASVPPTPPTAPGVPSTAPTSNDEDLFGNRPPQP